MQLTDPELQIGNVSLPLGTQDIDFQTVADGKRLSFSIPADDVGRLLTAWQEVVHSQQPVTGNRQLSDVTPGISSVSSSGRSEVSSLEKANDPAASQEIVTYIQAAPIGVVSREVRYSEILYSEVHYRTVHYFESSEQNHETMPAESRSGAGLDGESLTLLGRGPDSRMLVICLMGVTGLDVSVGRANVATSTVTLTLNENISTQELLWMIQGNT